MCLSIDYTKTVKARLTRDQYSAVTRYKVLKIDLDEKGELTLMSNTFHHKWKEGENKSDCRTIPSLEKLQPHQVSSLDKGIHVYTTRKEAIMREFGLDDAKYFRVEQELEENAFIVPVRCGNNDLIAVGCDGDELYQAVTLDYTTYDKTIARAKKAMFVGLANCGYNIASLMSSAV